MSDKKCKCGEDAKWVYDNEFYCEDCLCMDFCIEEVVPPRRCEHCNTPLKGSYFTDNDDDNAFCSRKCALEYYDAVLVEERDDDE